MEQLQAMGFEAYKCERALAECGQNVEAAVEFVFANSHQPEEWWRQEVAIVWPQTNSAHSICCGGTVLVAVSIATDEQCLLAD